MGILFPLNVMGDFRVQIFPLRGFFPGTTTHHPYYQSKVTHYDHIVLEKLSPYGRNVKKARRRRKFFGGWGILAKIPPLFLGNRKQGGIFARNTTDTVIRAG